jgi:tetratricopeptide (TPR) repeat protein
MARVIACPKCQRRVAEKRTCMCCGALLTTAPAAVLGMNEQQWVAEGLRVAALGQHERAVGCFDKALQVNPSSAVAWFNRSVALQFSDPDEAERSARRALALAPGSAKVIAHLKSLEKFPRGLPPGRPGPTLMEAMASGDRGAAIGGTAILTLKKRGLIKGGEEILVVNWYLSVPAPPADTGVPAWDVGPTRETGVLARFFTTGRVAVGSCYTAEESGAAMADAALDQHELDAWAWLLERGVATRVLIFGNLPWSEAPLRRAEVVNLKLAARGVPEGRRVMLTEHDEDA